ncbi:hypothetical protein MPER_10006 [Moniliophthora perniciosa FA553]|nr:hypothetical protein MPER_10006 [Moniliophthora perniciosa FA553]
MTFIIRIVENVRQRMEVVYGRSQPKARLHSTSNVYLRSPVRIISKPGSQPGRPSSAGGGDPGVIPDGTPSAPEGPPEAPHSQPSIPPEPPMLNFPSVASPGTGTSPPSVPDVETFPLTHRLQIATESRRRLTESLSKFGASTSSLFDLSTLEVTESAKPIPLRPRTRRTTAPKLGSQLLAASSSHSLRKSIGSKSEKSREKQTGLEKDDMGGTEEATEESNGGRDLRPKRSDKGKGKQKEILEEDGDEAEAVGEDDMNGLDGTERRSKRKRREKLIQEATRSSMEVDREEEESNQDGPIQRDNGRRMTKGVE